VSLAPSARADTESELDAARARLGAIEHRIAGQRAILDRIEARIGDVAERVSDAEIALEAVRSRLRATRDAIAEARVRYETLQGRLGTRVREFYMQGPTSGIDVVLGATSFGDLLDRVEYSTAVAQADSDLITQVQNLRKQLRGRELVQQRLLEKQQSALSDLRTKMAGLDREFDHERSAVAAIEAERAKAEHIVSGLSQEYRQQLASSIPASPSTSTFSGSGPFQACPVGLPRALTDSFGAPRSGGGYHLHEGVDIMAPTGTPIYATFSGTATGGGSELGGISVVVSGPAGWTYNAHLSRIGQVGNVQAGDVIGYVGATGDTSTPHDHFEWHPNVIPSNWPASAYGYSVIDDAVNPYPILTSVC
jgi:murein DD-endopeptidase MepM/ murein hydrolase activator NlpD